MSNEVEPTDSEIDDELGSTDEPTDGEIDDGGEAELTPGEIDREFEACLGYVRELRALKTAHSGAYANAIKVLQACARGEIGRPPSVTSAMVDTILSELGEELKSARAEITAVLAVADEPEDPEREDEFMGDPNTFVRIDDAVAGGLIPEDIL